ncbi:unnamed protein product, partial [Closterium sp. NIES-53]
MLVFHLTLQVFLHLVLDKTTFHLLDERRLNMMKKVVDEVGRQCLVCPRALIHNTDVAPRCTISPCCFAIFPPPRPQDAILGLVTDKVALWTCVFHACLPVTSMLCLHSPSSPLQDAILVNCSRGPVVDEVALLKHLKANPAFRAALDVFEDKPLMNPGLSTLLNVVVVPHIASASQWTRAGMAGLAALNVT